MRDAQSEHIWALAREDYHGGLPVGLVCSGYNLARSTFYDRARREGWLRPEEARLAEPDAGPKPPPAPPTHELARLALDQAAAAVAAGDVRAVCGWLRAAERLRAMAVQESDLSSWWGVQTRLARAAPAPALCEPATDVSLAPDTSGHLEAPQPVVEQGIAPEYPDSPDQKNPAGPDVVSGLSPEALIAQAHAMIRESRAAVAKAKSTPGYEEDPEDEAFWKALDEDDAFWDAEDP